MTTPTPSSDAAETPSNGEPHVAPKNSGPKNGTPQDGERHDTQKRPLPQWMNVVALVAIVALVIGAVYFTQRPKSDDADIEMISEVDSGSTQSLDVGQPAPDFKTLDVNGYPFLLADTAGQPTWLVFNATWCSGCRAEIPEVQQLAARDDVEVIGIYFNETSDEVRPFVERLDLDYTHLADPNAEISGSYGVSGVPSHVLIDKNGNIAWTKIGTINEADIEQAMAKLQSG